MNNIDLIEIPGTLYRAIPVYSIPGELDDIAWFFYEQVLPREKRIDCLRDLFALPIRFIEDILAELIHKNYALLDVANGMIIPVKEPKLKRELNETAETLFWQDSVTGTVISLQTIPSLYLNRQVAQNTSLLHKPGVGRQFPDFLDMPSARIIAMLKMSSRRIVFHRELGNLDSIVSRRKSGACPLFLRVRRAEADGIPFCFIEAPELPELLIRHWSRELNRQMQDISERVLPQILFAGETRETFFDLCSLTSVVDKWLQSIHELAEAESISVFHSKLSQYHFMTNSLLQMVGCLSQLDLATPESFDSHIEDMSSRAEKYIMLQSDKVPGSAEPEFKRIFGSIDLKPPFFLLEQANSNSEPAEPSSARQTEKLHRHHLSEAPGTGVCIIDSKEARIASTTDLSGKGLVFRLRGIPLVKETAKLSISYCNASNTTWYLESLVDDVMPDFRTTHLNKGFGRAFEPAGSQDEDEIDQNISRLVEETEVLIRNSLPTLLKKWEEFDSSLSVKDEAQCSSIPPDLWVSIPKLSECVARARTWRFQNQASLSRSAVHVGDAAVPLDTLANILSDLSGEDMHSVGLILDFVAQNSIDESTIKLLTKSLDWTEMTLFLNPESSDGRHDPRSVEAIRAIQNIGHFRLTVVLGSIRLPPCILVDSRFVVFGPRAWFQREEHKPWLIAAEAPQLASTMINLMKEAKPIP